MTSIDETLAERDDCYGEFKNVANSVQALKTCLYGSRNWTKMSNSQKEALEMIVHKIGRILNGDPDYADSWHDIGGYARLIEIELT